MVDNKIKKSILSSVLCWLATSDNNQQPNVSPKEVFSAYGSDSIIIANIASPQTLKNIKYNPLVCVSFIDIFLQKGYQLKGKADIIDSKNVAFLDMEKILLEITHGKYPFSTITKITVTSVKEIIAPGYILYPDTTEKDQIKSALDTYKVKDYLSK